MPPLTLGYSHKRLRLDADAIALIQSAGVRHLELRVDDIDPAGAMHQAGFRRDLRSLCDDLGLTLSVHAFPGVNLAEKVGRLRSVCIDLHLEQMEFCEAVGARWLNVHLGTCGFGQDPERKAHRLAMAGDSLDRLIETTAGFRVGLGLENVERLPPGLKKAYLGDRLEELRAVLDGRGARIGAVFDTGHANLNAARDAAELFEGLRDRLWSVHVHANLGDVDRHETLTRAWVVERPQLFAALAQSSRRGIPLIAEHHTVEHAAATLNVLSRLEEFLDPRAAP